MALTRKTLKGMGLTEEQIDSIIEGHDETVSALKATIVDLTDKANASDALKKERDDLKKQIENANNGTDWKAEYENLKADTEAKETRTKLKSAYRALLKAEKIDERDHDLILAGTDFTAMKLDKDGKLANEEKLTEAIREKYADRVVTEGQKTTPTKTPPGGGKVTRTREEIMSIKDTAERQRAMLENPELFGL